MTIPESLIKSLSETAERIVVDTIGINPVELTLISVQLNSGACVYRAKMPKGKDLAIKIEFDIRGRVVAEGDQYEAFNAERRIIWCPSLRSRGTKDGFPFIVTDFLTGYETFDSLLDRGVLRVQHLSSFLNLLEGCPRVELSVNRRRCICLKVFRGRVACRVSELLAERTAWQFDGMSDLFSDITQPLEDACTILDDAVHLFGLYPGDAHFGNILFHEHGRNIKVVDLGGRWPLPIAYDLGKLLQSTLGRYHDIVRYYDAMNDANYPHDDLSFHEREALLTELTVSLTNEIRDRFGSDVLRNSILSAGIHLIAAAVHHAFEPARVSAMLTRGVDMLSAGVRT